MRFAFRFLAFLFFVKGWAGQGKARPSPPAKWRMGLDMNSCTRLASLYTYSQIYLHISFTVLDRINAFNHSIASVTNLGGPPSTGGDTMQHSARSTGVSSSRLPVIYQESSSRTRVLTHPPEEPTNSTFRNLAQKCTDNRSNSKVPYSTINYRKVLDIYQV